MPVNLILRETGIDCEPFDRGQVWVLSGKNPSAPLTQPFSHYLRGMMMKWLWSPSHPLTRKDSSRGQPGNGERHQRVLENDGWMHCSQQSSSPTQGQRRCPRGSLECDLGLGTWRQLGVIQRKEDGLDMKKEVSFLSQASKIGVATKDRP